MAYTRFYLSWKTYFLSQLFNFLGIQAALSYSSSRTELEAVISITAVVISITAVANSTKLGGFKTTEIHSLAVPGVKVCSGAHGTKVKVWAGLGPSGGTRKHLFPPSHAWRHLFLGLWSLPQLQTSSGHGVFSPSIPLALVLLSSSFPFKHVWVR